MSHLQRENCLLLKIMFFCVTGLIQKFIIDQKTARVLTDVPHKSPKFLCRLLKIKGEERVRLSIKN